MSIKRYFSNYDTTITNAYQSNLTTKGTGSNMGASDILETFQIYGQYTSSSVELSRILVQFPITEIISDRSDGNIPAADSVSFYLKFYNTEHARTTPDNFDLSILAVSSSWQEGVGLDMENYTDKTYDKLGANWIKSSGSTSWTTAGGDYHASPSYSVSMEKGTENIDLDVTTLVEQWIAGSKSNYGFGIRLSSTFESASQSYYTKKFFGRGTEFFYKKPAIEARWDSSSRDQRGEFYASSSLAPADDNNNTLFLYNYVRGQLKNIPSIGTSNIYVDLYETLGDSALTLCGDTPATGSHVSSGIYKVSLCTNSTATTLYDVWHDGSAAQFHTGTITPKSYSALSYNSKDQYFVNITNLKDVYDKNEIARFNLHVRPKNWSPTIYTKASSTPDSTTIPTASYEVCREIDNFKVIPYGTGSTMHTIMSHDVNGNYFDLDMSMFEGGYSYRIKFAFYDTGVKSYIHQPYEFKFRVRENVY